MVDIAHFWGWDNVAVTAWDKPMREFAACGHTKFAMTASQALRAAFSNSFVKQLKKQLADAGCCFTGVHAPFADQWDLLAADPEFAPIRLYVHRRLIEILPAEFGIHEYTMHLLNDLYPGTPDDAEEQMGKVLEPLLEVAARNDVVIAIENGFQAIDIPETIPRYMHRYASDHFGCCLDLAHANVIAKRRNANVEDYIDALSPYIIACHLHDNDGLADRHWVPGEPGGTVDWKRCMPKLAAAPRLQSLQNESHSAHLTIPELCKRIDAIRNF